MKTNQPANRRSVRRAFSLIEVIVTMTILAILISLSTPSVMRTMEQSHADLAGAGLRMISTAQRFYWLENRTYADDLQTLIDAELVDQDLVTTAPRYEFSILAADAQSFRASARRRRFDDSGNPVYRGAWEGEFVIDQTGTITGVVEGPNTELTPAF